MAKPARRPDPPARHPLGWERKGFFLPPDLVDALRVMSKGFTGEGDFLRFLLRQEWNAWKKKASPTT